MRPIFKVLNDELVNQIIDEALGLLRDPGVRVHNHEALKLLAAAGADVDIETQIARWRQHPLSSIFTIWRGNRSFTMVATAFNSTPALQPLPSSIAKRNSNERQ
jgi:trimethylamine:corrinoid methyltransferase-like protein